MEFHIRNTQDDGEFGTAKNVIISKFNSVTIFGEDYTKIVYMHTEEDFTIERVDGVSHDLEDNTQVVSGPRACEIIEHMLECEKKRGATFVWNGARFKDSYNRDIEDDLDTDPLCTDYVENENERRERRRHERRKGDRRKASDTSHMDPEA